MKQPVSITPITVPTVGAFYAGGVIEGVIIGHLQTSSGPSGYEGRHATLSLTVAQAEALVYELAAKLGLEVTL